MAIDFPSSPNVNDTFTSGSIVYTYDGTKWTAEPAGVSGGTKIEVSNTKAEIIDTGSDGRFVVTTEGTERARIDSSGKLLVGTNSARSNFYNGPFTNGPIQVEGSGFDNSGASLIHCSTTAGWSGRLVFARGRGSAGSNTLVSSGDILGEIFFLGNDGTEFVEGAKITAYVDGSPGANDMPGRIVCSTTADGGTLPTERMRLISDGTLFIGKTTYDQNTGIELQASGRVYCLSSAAIAGLFDRKTNDGDIILFRQDGVTEGSISVSGSTVSYNGAHLSRWSQLPGGATREEILRGTVLSNIDEMCAWGDEDNEQLNRMKVSDVEGDPNVSGVFQSWDDDDDTYTDDFYCAMTGDFIIRIADGVTVQRGDLLMSAGDGTAKPQDDDIVRSKTIAKVTSNHVTCTYEDGSYCVPCVLMAC